MYNQEKRPFLRRLYDSYVPFTLLALVPFVVMLAILESGRGLGQRVSFAVVSLVNILVQLAWGLYLGYRVYYVGRQRTDERPLSIVRFLDSWFGLMFAWGMGAMAFWVIDTSPAQDHFWSFEPDKLANPENNWLVALDFVFDMVHIMTASSASAFGPHQIVVRLLLFCIEVFHIFYLPLVIALVAIYQFDKQREESKDQQNIPLLLNVPPPASVPVQYATPQVLMSQMRLPREYDPDAE